MVNFKEHNIHLYEAVIDYKFYRACAAEFIAMFFFVVMCCGCAMVTLAGSNPNFMQVATSFGFGIMVLAQFVGPLSGGHINCAVSLALFVGGRISGVRFVAYTLSQMLGSIFGALVLWSIFGNNWPAARAFGSNSWDTSVYTGGQVFFAEMIGTMLLVYNVFATIDSPREGGGPLGVFPIAMSVMVAHLFLLPIDGCSINPTRSFGPTVVASWAGIKGDYQKQHYMFWFGPCCGALFAAVVYEYGAMKPRKREGALDMDTALFMADKGKQAEAPAVPLGDEDGPSPTIDDGPSDVRVMYDDEQEIEDGHA